MSEPNPENVRVAVSGAVWKGATTATAPTGPGTDLTASGFTSLGGMSTDGVTHTMPSTGETEVIHFWQDNAQARVIRTVGDDLPTWQFTALETNIAVIEATYGVTVTQTEDHGSYVVDTSAPRSANSYVIDYIDGAHDGRDYIPRGVVSEIGDKVYQNGQPIGYQLTIQGEYVASLGGNFKAWNTALADPTP